MRSSGLLRVGAATVLVALLAGCSSSAGVATGTGAPAGGEKVAAGELAGGKEGPSVPFTHPTLRYTVSAPGPMVVAANGDASYTGTSDFLHVSLVPGPADPLSSAAADARGAGVPGFALTSPAQAVTIGSLSGASVEFTRDGATNPVTGRAQTAHVLRAYVPGPGGMYRLEYGATVSNQNWDPQGAMDQLSTFRPGP